MPDVPDVKEPCRCSMCLLRRFVAGLTAGDKATDTPPAPTIHPLRAVAATFREEATDLLAAAEGYDALADLSEASPDSPTDKALAALYNLAHANR